MRLSSSELFQTKYADSIWIKNQQKEPFFVLKPRGIKFFHLIRMPKMSLLMGVSNCALNSSPYCLLNTNLWLRIFSTSVLILLVGAYEMSSTHWRHSFLVPGIWDPTIWSPFHKIFIRSNIVFIVFRYFSAVFLNYRMFKNIDIHRVILDQKDDFFKYTLN